MIDGHKIYGFMDAYGCKCHLLIAQLCLEIFFTIFNPAVFDGGGDRSRMQQVIPEHLAHGELPSSTRLPDDGSGMARSNG